MTRGDPVTPLECVLDALERAGCGPRRSGESWQARCPAHDDRGPSLSISEGDDGRVLLHCFAGCEFARIVQALGLRASDLFASDRHVARARPDAHGGARRPTPRGKPRPPGDQVHALWAQCRPLDQDRDASAWARARGLDPLRVADRDLARALPADAAVPDWARLSGTPWPKGGYRVVVPLYDPSGRIETLHARNVRLDAVPKGALPAGYAAAGLVMADAGGVRMLAGGGWLPCQVWIAEGVPDFLTLACDFNESDDESAILGVVSGSWSRVIADRIPDGCRVVIATHDDPAGDRYAMEIETTLVGRTQLFRWQFAAPESPA